MSVDPEIEAKCKEISDNYSACDVSLPNNERLILPTPLCPTMKAAKKKTKKKKKKKGERI